ncbi:MAG: hypothetical protein HGB19_09880 [Chlorobiales bacterium]|nr:hypothetical protein [Chlorobiales bacterium]
METKHFALFALILLLFTQGCSDKGVSLKGNASIATTTGIAPVANTPVILVPDSLVIHELEQRRDGLQMLLATVSTKRGQMVTELDTLKARYAASNYQDSLIKSHYEAITDSIHALKEETKKFKMEYIGSIAQWLSNRAVAKVQTDGKGDFSFENVKPGKYVVASVYGVSNLVGLLIKPVDLNTTGKADLTIQDRDAVFYIDEEDRP